MRIPRKTTLLVALLVFGSGCAVPKSMTVRTMKPILEVSSEEILMSRDVKTVGEGLPAQILTVQGLLASKPGDTEVTAMAVQLHLFYGTGFVESKDESHASALYAEGRDIGLDYLSRKKHFADSLRAGDLALGALLTKYGKKDAPVILWTAACWGSWVRLHLDDPSAVADLPLVEALLERVLEVEPEMFHGMPWIFRGTMHALRPPALGGKPEEALRAFEQGFRVSDRKFLLGLLFFARTYCKQVFDQDLYEATLQEILDAPDDLLPEVRLLNLIAKEQAEEALAMIDEIF